MSNSTQQTSLNFSWQQGAKFAHAFPIDFTSQDIYKAVAAKLYPSFIPPADEPGCDNRTVFPFRLTHIGKNIPQNYSNPDDKTKFDDMKRMMTPKSVILVVERLHGGGNNGDMLNLDTHTRRFFSEVKVELNKIVEYPNNKCLLCLENKNCIKISCAQATRCLNTVCTVCLLEYYARKNYTTQCLICKKFSDLESYLANAEFKMLPNGNAKMTLSEEFKISHAQFKESIELTRYIDFQICKCGCYFVNATMYSRQNCPKCQRWMCFFCNENWDQNTMRNQQYTCGVPTCKYQQLLVFEMEESESYKGFWLPSTRCCPKCGTYGGYGTKCKFNQCANCKDYWYCFLCLKSQSECGTECNAKCVDPPVQQTYTVFPRMES
ncbi:unnamed protein product [Rotaria socialis]|uniref:Uncharacterized protein n=1 Tax=Rotaria socialis TaxID=392032 RepID=A0A821JMB3_9BILA|nr:unnamed protein product [Rotaria socialis]CAF4723472.1 unnamed protein product [Rotaria socialis]